MDEFTTKRAQKLLDAGLAAVAQGDIRGAREKFEASAKVHPTADALTYWGWMEHHLGNTDRAIELCHEAIEKDPAFGNPYNDIGSYLIAKGKVDDAIPWLEKAIEATRYEPRQFPHINLGRIFLAKEMPMRALKELQKALEIAPDDEGIRDMISQIQRTLN